MDIPKVITKEFLRENPNCVFVFGDNRLRKGKKGAAELRDEPNTYGFITKKEPNNNDESFFKPVEYRYVFEEEMRKLMLKIINNPNKIFLISRLGSGLADKYNISEKVINLGIIRLKRFPNVIFLD